jgi:ubiquitin C-terminal hydrolase
VADALAEKDRLKVTSRADFIEWVGVVKEDNSLTFPVTGLGNLGNTCFANVIAHVLTRNPDMRKLIISLIDVEELFLYITSPPPRGRSCRSGRAGGVPVGKRILLALQAMIATGDSRFSSALEGTAFGDKKQHDAAEFFEYALVQLDSCVPAGPGGDEQDSSQDNSHLERVKDLYGPEVRQTCV